MSFFDWMLAFHLLSAFAVAAALVLFSVLVFNGRRMTTLEQTRTLFRVAPVGTRCSSAASALVLVFGVILALDSDSFNIWDGWIIAGIVLWAAFAGGRPAQRRVLHEVQKLAESRRGHRGRGAGAPARVDGRDAALRDRRALRADRSST